MTEDPDASLCSWYVTQNDTSQPSGFQNIRVAPQSGSHQAEIDIVRSPIAENVFFIGSMAYLISEHPGYPTDCWYSPPGIVSTLTHYLSIDTGLTWTGGDSLLVGHVDPTVAMDNNGHLYYAFYKKWIQKSTDNDSTWTQPYLISPEIGEADRPKVRVDANTTNYVGCVWNTTSNIYYARSVDTGATFETAVLVSSTADYSSSCRGLIAPDLAFGPGGEVYVVWSYGLGFTCGIKFAKSADYGETFDTLTIPLEGFSGGLWGCFLGAKVNGYPSIAVDTTGGPHNGRIYVAYCMSGSPGDHRKVYCVHTDNEGISWDGPLLVCGNDSPSPSEQWFPKVNVNPLGGISIVYYDSRVGAFGNYHASQVWLAYSPDGGGTFINFRISDNTFIPCGFRGTNAGCNFMGDYIGIESNSDWIVPAWTEYREPGPLNNDECGQWQAFVGRIPTRMSVSGIISRDTTWAGAVLLTGDVIIADTVTVTIAAGASVFATASSDDQAGGADSSLVEIIVEGTLRIPDSAYGGTRPVFRADVNTVGGWYGLRVTDGGQFQTGRGAIIANSVVGLTHEEGAMPDTIASITVEGPVLCGFWSQSDAMRYVNDSVRGVEAGYGFFLDQADVELDSCFIESCEYGVYALFSSSAVSRTTVKGPGDYGVYVFGADELLVGADTIRLVGDTISGYFTSALVYASAVGHCTIEGCRLWTGQLADTDSTAYGIKAYNGSYVFVRDTEIAGYGSVGFYSYKSASDLGSPVGDNAIYTSVSCYHCNPLCVIHIPDSTETLKAEKNWWGLDPPSAFWFSLNVDYTPWRTSSPFAKIAGYSVRAEGVHSSSISQNSPNPFNDRTVIEFTLAERSHVKISVYNVLGQLVRDIESAVHEAGTYRCVWDGTDMNHHAVASGVYFYRFVADKVVESKKLVLLR